MTNYSSLYQFTYFTNWNVFLFLDFIFISMTIYQFHFTSSPFLSGILTKVQGASVLLKVIYGQLIEILIEIYMFILVDPTILDENNKYINIPHKVNYIRKSSIIDNSLFVLKDPNYILVLV